MKNEIWKYFTGEWQAFSPDLKAIRKLRTLKKVRSNGIYTFQGKTVGRTILLPTQLYDRVAKELKLSPRRKSKGRVAWGMHVGRSAKHRHRNNGKFASRSDSIAYKG